MKTCPKCKYHSLQYHLLPGGVGYKCKNPACGYAYLKRKSAKRQIDERYKPGNDRKLNKAIKTVKEIGNNLPSAVYNIDMRLKNGTEEPGA